MWGIRVSGRRGRWKLYKYNTHQILQNDKFKVKKSHNDGVCVGWIWEEESWWIWSKYKNMLLSKSQILIKYYINKQIKWKHTFDHFICSHIVSKLTFAKAFSSKILCNSIVLKFQNSEVRNKAFMVFIAFLYFLFYFISVYISQFNFLFLVSGGSWKTHKIDYQIN